MLNDLLLRGNVGLTITLIFDEVGRIGDATAVVSSDKGGLPDPSPIAGTSPTSLLFVLDEDTSEEVLDCTAGVTIDDKQRVVVEIPLGRCISNSTHTVAFGLGTATVVGRAVLLARG